MTSATPTAFELTEEFIQSRRGIQLYTRKYIPSQSHHIVFVFLHGVGEHCSRYHDTFTTLASQGIAVHALDHHGHGHSEGPRFDCVAFDHFTDDIATFTDHIRSAYTSCHDVKYFLGGVSLGGLLAATVAVAAPDRWDGVILYAPAIGIEYTWILRLQSIFAPVLEWLVPTWEIVPGVIPKWISRNLEYLDDYTSDPLNNHRPLKVRLAMSIERSMHALLSRQSDFRTPLLLFHGTADLVTSPVMSERFFNAIPAQDKTFESLPGQFHALLNEPERAATVLATVNWLKARSKL
ncbi:hypothetical protein H310_14380 [Aphanomyces invadans]|uniref:Serine aminopeptidase S33 domain-containing protein n=1 Tax=Aphanomyces invadans TaxID=157072 RepID=A0A024TBD0_9STRA|nr:hypothetical protein H310_14380 [Aphanomyces invadans]ETV90886.1 hypothetical protein H310_14380 [Aphanomyces invadans]|eukprot:XP_008880451.1 hypothetical protein H310_14380 [Aphanomyces invadans]